MGRCISLTVSLIMSPFFSMPALSDCSADCNNKSNTPHLSQIFALARRFLIPALHAEEEGGDMQRRRVSTKPARFSIQSYVSTLVNNHENKLGAQTSWLRLHFKVKKSPLRREENPSFSYQPASHEALLRLYILNSSLWFQAPVAQTEQ